jgi:diadenosine tetraphosphate (Ap4A) HIT family hydrolase
VAKRGRRRLGLYVCVVARQHVIEPFEMKADDQAAFWRDAMLVARAIADYCVRSR